MAPSTLTPIIPQAGGAVFRIEAGVPEVLLVRARQDPSKWVLPKGHIEPDELPEEAAVREAREEGGAIGNSLGPIDPVLTFRSGSERVRVQYYLIHSSQEIPSPEAREKQWLPEGEAIQLTSFEDSHKLLHRVFSEIRRRATLGVQSSREFLIAEYEHLAASLLQNEESAEKRVTFLLAVAAAAGGILGFALGRDNGLQRPAQQALVLGVLGGLLVFGYFCLVRVVHRNIATDDYKRRLNRLRRSFCEQSPDHYVRSAPFDPYSIDGRRLSSPWRVGKAGWLETVALVNALVFGALAASTTLVAAPNVSWVSPIAGVSGVLVGWVFMIAHGARLYRRESRGRMVLERKRFSRSDERQAESLIGPRVERAFSALGYLEPAQPSMGKAVSYEADTMILILDGSIRVDNLETCEVAWMQTGDALYVPKDTPHRLQGKGSVEVRGRAE